MNLRKQLFLTFCSVAVLPLAVVTFYMFGSNLMLAFNLYMQNLQNSTEIQSDLVEENINQLMTRSIRFASLDTVRTACVSGDTFLSKSQELSKDILNFTDETLHNVAAFALTDQHGEILHFSGSNSDKRALEDAIASSNMEQSQNIREIPFAEHQNALLIDTPVKLGEDVVGRLFVACSTDYFLRIISTHKQVESSNAFIYCNEHELVVTSKLYINNKRLKLTEGRKSENEGAFIGKIDRRRVLAYSQPIAKTDWILVSTISASQILSRIWNYGLINAIALLSALIAIVLLSRSQSRRMLHPFDQLLNAVEQFFISNTAQFPHTDIDPHTEIGYLAEKFAGMSKDMASAQGKLRESNYLYAALMRATYEFRMVIDLQTDTVECSDGELSEQLQRIEGGCVSERILHLWKMVAVDDKVIETLLEDIAYGRLSEPVETEICYRLQDERGDSWYRIIAVPIIQADRSVCRMVIHFEDITMRKHREFGLIHTSQVDPLCGLLNKTAFPLYCKQSGPGKTDAVFFIDLDKFKQVNDMLGHAAGDEMLLAAAAAIRNQFRDTDTIGRFGGDEFVVFAPNMTQAQAQRKAAALVRALSFQRNTPREIVIHVTASVGVCVAKSPMALEQSISIADEAMYYAKEHGKAQYHIAPQNDAEKGVK